MMLNVEQVLRMETTDNPITLMIPPMPSLKTFTTHSLAVIHKYILIMADHRSNIYIRAYLMHTNVIYMTINSMMVCACSYVPTS